jgi:hypothetical protein
MVMIAAAASAGPVRQDQALGKLRPRQFGGVAASAPALISRTCSCFACAFAGRTEQEVFTRRVWGVRPRFRSSWQHQLFNAELPSKFQTNPDGDTVQFVAKGCVIL